MKKTFAVFLSVFILLAGCAKKPDNSKNGTVDLYFLNADGNSMVVETVSVPDGTDDKLSFALEKLLEGPKDALHKKVLPDGVSYNSITLEDGIATIDLSSEFNIGSNVE